MRRSEVETEWGAYGDTEGAIEVEYGAYEEISAILPCEKLYTRAVQMAFEALREFHPVRLGA